MVSDFSTFQRWLSTRNGFQEYVYITLSVTRVIARGFYALSWQFCTSGLLTWGSPVWLWKITESQFCSLSDGRATSSISCMSAGNPSREFSTPIPLLTALYFQQFFLLNSYKLIFILYRKDWGRQDCSSEHNSSSPRKQRYFKTRYFRAMMDVLKCIICKWQICTKERIREFLLDMLQIVPLIITRNVVYWGGKKKGNRNIFTINNFKSISGKNSIVSCTQGAKTTSLLCLVMIYQN